MLQQLKAREVESLHFASVINLPEMRAGIEAEAEILGLGIVIRDSSSPWGHPSTPDALVVTRFDDYAVAYGIPR